MHTGASWHTLASDAAEADGGEDGLPSHAEVEETARRLFAGATTLDVPGALPARRSPSPAGWSGFALPEDDDAFAHPDEDEDEYEMRAFDLSRVFGALQGMKEEIAGITDEGERRKAAARVALGLVYGLQREQDEGEEF